LYNNDSGIIEIIMAVERFKTGLFG